MIDSVSAPEVCQESAATLKIGDPRYFDPVRRPQPIPVLTQVARLRVGGQVVSSIHRQWRPGDTRLCRLCPFGQCSASHDSCLITTVGHVGKGREAALHRSSSIGRPGEA
jgi:hypothetical protein